MRRGRSSAGRAAGRCERADPARRRMGPDAAPRARRRIGFVFQDPGTSLNPLLTLERQITESLEAHAR